MKKRILFVLNNGLHRGGTQAVIMSIVRGLSKKYLFDILLFTNEKADYDEEFKSYGGNIYRILNYEGNNKFRKRIDIYLRWIWNRKKVKKILENNYDAIHCTNNFECGYVLEAAYKAKIPIRIPMAVIITETTKLRSIYNSFMLKKINKYSTAKVGCSKEACETMFKKDFYVIPNSYRKEFDAPINKQKFNSPILIQIGYLGNNKNQLFGIKVFNELFKKDPNSLLHIIGFEAEEGYKDKLHDLVEKFGIKNNVFFHESNANTFELLDNSTHLLLPSIKEAFGIVLLEAQARGLKCIVSDTANKAANVGGCIFLPLDKGEAYWAETIMNDFLKNSGQHQEYDLSNFKENVILKLYEDLYEGRISTNNKH